MFVARVGTMLCFVALAGCTCGPGARRTTPAVSTSQGAPTPPPPREVVFVTADGVSITGTLTAAASPQAPLVILVHQLSSSRAEWAPLLARLHAEPRIATLAIDLRGHGGSTRGPGDRTLSWREFTRQDWAATPEDVLAAVAWARSPDSGIAPSRIAAVGSSIGSSAILVAAAREPAIAAIAAISPGRAYHGLDAISPATHLSGRPFWAIVAEGETDSADAARALARITGGEVLVVPGDVHGVRLLEEADRLDRLETFLRGALGAPRQHEAP